HCMMRIPYEKPLILRCSRSSLYADSHYIFFRLRRIKGFRYALPITFSLDYGELMLFLGLAFPPRAIRLFVPGQHKKGEGPVESVDEWQIVPADDRQQERTIPW